MATPAERQALLFIAIVAVLGVCVRVYRSHHKDTNATQQSQLSKDSQNTNDESPRTAKRRKKGSSPRQRAPLVQPDDDPNPPLVDLDIASLDEIDAIGVLLPGQARQIIADRDANGPFGSIRALERIPYFPKSSITKLAPRVTFSRVPRPSNAVIQRRSEETTSRSAAPVRRTRRRHLDVSP